MKIKEVEYQTGITSHNIRFYEKEKLILPKRNSENGYREYTAEDVELLKRIRLLRMMDIPVSDIRECLNGRKDLSDILSLQLENLKAEEERIRQNRLLCGQLIDADAEIKEIPLEIIEQVLRDKDTYCDRLEDLHRRDRRKRLVFLSQQAAGILGWLFVITLALLFYAELCSLYMSGGLRLAAFSIVLCWTGSIFYQIRRNEDG